MSKCTWVDCKNTATSPQIAKDGQQWANLCDEHVIALEKAQSNAKGMIGAWIKAQGGAKIATDRVMGRSRD